MRRLLIALVATVALLGLTGCGLLKSDEDKKIERIFDESDPVFSIFFRTDVTSQQKTNIDEYLRGLPDVAEVEHESREQAYQRFKELWADDPDFVEQVTPNSLPESYRVHMADFDALRAVRDGSDQANIKNLPGVQDIIIPCTTVDECREQLEKSRK